jgi:hypothetical protein
MPAAVAGRNQVPRLKKRFEKEVNFYEILRSCHDPLTPTLLPNEKESIVGMAKIFLSDCIVFSVLQPPAANVQTLKTSKAGHCMA